ncbi:MAG: tRNA (guanosine(37)-N1)-methyltransferase TrmD [Bacilli bacterium]
MRIDIITIFPEMFDGIINNSIIKRSIDKGIVEIHLHDFREYTTDKHKKVDDTTYGGGAGMLIRVQPIADCLRSIKGYKDAKVLLTRASGKVYNQARAQELAKEEHIIIICGHYEGIDNRILNFVDEEVSIGDYILTGGELPAAIITDSIIRLIPDSISKKSLKDESFTNGLLEYPQFTKPSVYEGLAVPECLVNGNHERIRRYRLYMSLKTTYLNRPDLLEGHKFTEEEERFLKLIKANKNLDTKSLDK